MPNTGRIRKRNDPNNPFRVGQERNNKRICGAKTSAGEPCIRSPMVNGRCATHGGKTPVGIAASNFQTGRHSKYLPQNLLGRYDEFASDPRIIELTDELALIDTRITQLMERIPQGDNGAFWRTLHEQWKSFSIAIRTNDTEASNRLLGEIGETIRSGSNEYKLWDDITKLTEQRRKLADTELKRLQAAQQMVTIAQAMAMFTAMISGLKESVYLYADKTTAQHILTDAQKRYNVIVGVPAIGIRDSDAVGQTD